MRGLNLFGEDAIFIVEFSFIVKAVGLFSEFANEVLDHFAVQLDEHLNFFFVFLHFEVEVDVGGELLFFGLDLETDGIAVFDGGFEVFVGGFYHGSKLIINKFGTA